MSLITRLCYQIENYFTFKPQFAQACDLRHYNQTTQLIESALRPVAVRYKIKDSPHFVFFSHGNGSSIESISHIYSFYEELGLSYLAYDYPGYSNSPGTPSAQGCYENFNVVYNFLVNELRVQPQTIICHGLSLGGAVAVHAALGKPISKFVLEATFTSGADMARYKFPYIPGVAKISRQFDSLSKIQNLTGDVLFIHGNQDTVIPVEHSQRLFAKCRAAKYLHIIENCGHSGHSVSGGAAYRTLWLRFLAAGVKDFKN